MRVLLIVAVVVVLSGCGQDTVAQKDLPSPSPTPQATSVLGSPSPTYIDRRCPPDTEQPPPPLGLPADAICISVVHGNFDGTASNQSLAVYSLRSFQPGQRWYVRLDKGAGRILTADLNTLFRGSLQLLDVFVLGAGDGRGDGRDEAFIDLYHGASTSFIGILGMEGSHLAPAVTATGQRGFALGGGSMHAAYVLCEGSGPTARLILSGWGSGAGGTYEWERTSYSWSGMHLNLVGTESGSMKSRDEAQLVSLGKGPSCWA
jgi:hypothetical protein